MTNPPPPQWGPNPNQPYQQPYAQQPYPQQPYPQQPFMPPPPKKKGMPNWLAVVVACAAILIVALCGSALLSDDSSSDSSSTTTTTEVAETSREATTTTTTATTTETRDPLSSDGVYKIGVEIQPGEYKYVGRRALSSWTICKDSNCSSGNIVDISGPIGDGETGYLTIPTSGYVELSGLTLTKQ